MKHTVITCDLALYEIAYTLRRKYLNIFSNVVHQHGGFHLCHTDEIKL